MDSIFEISARAQQRAWEIVADTQVVEIWEAVGATVNLVGSLKMGLLLNHHDIDFHIYTDPFRLSDSFAAISRLAENPRIKAIQYANLLQAEDRCIEWHASYEAAAGDHWQLDMIHILNDSPYAGYFERVAGRIGERLTPQTRQTILEIKQAVPAGKKVMGVQIYRAVLEDGVSDAAAFWQWLEQNPNQGIIDWMP